jgi:hypothetical protein
VEVLPPPVTPFLLDPFNCDTTMDGMKIYALRLPNGSCSPQRSMEKNRVGDTE